jgi:hypothetical protein
MLISGSAGIPVMGLAEEGVDKQQGEDVTAVVALAAANRT